MELSDFIHLVEETLEVRSGTISLDDDLDKLNWDSLANLSFIATIDERLGKPLDAQRLADCTSPRELLALVNDAVGVS